MSYFYDERTGEMTDEVNTKYGTVKIEDVPIIQYEEPHEANLRCVLFFAPFVAILILIVAYSAKTEIGRHANKQLAYKNLFGSQDQQYTASQHIVPPSMRLCTPSELNIKHIDIIVPTASFPGITLEKLNCLFGTYITRKSMVKSDIAAKYQDAAADYLPMAESRNYDRTYGLHGTWRAEGDTYQISFTLPNNIWLTSVVLHTLPDQIFAHGWQHTFRAFYIVLRDKKNNVVKQDTIAVDFNSGNVASGYIAYNVCQ